MTKREQYNLEFIKKVNSDGSTRRSITSNSAIYSCLLFVNHLSKSELEYFIETIDLIKNGLLYDRDFLIQNGTEASNITFDNPNIIIEALLTINILDFQALLQEWIAYLNT